MKINLEEYWEAEKLIHNIHAQNIGDLEFFYKGEKIEPEEVWKRGGWPGGVGSFIDWNFEKQRKDWKNAV